MTDKKKSAPRGAQFPEQEHCITSVDLAQALFDAIGTGPCRAIRRPKNAHVDRHLRRLISEANKRGDCIINDGAGYYRPGPEDEPELRHYLRAELSRANDIYDKVSAMSINYRRRCK